MSSTSPQAEAAGEQAAWQAGLAEQLSGLTAPELRQLTGQLSGMLKSTDSSGRMGLDRSVLSSAKSQLNAGYDQAGRGSRESIAYNALRAGEGRMGSPVVSSAIGQAATSLDRDRASALRNLEFMSAQSSLSDYNQVLSLLGQGANASLGLAQGFSGASGAAIGGLSNQSQLGNTMAGFGTGASAGAAIGSVIPGVGTVIGGLVGGVVGGAAGYVSSP